MIYLFLFQKNRALSLVSNGLEIFLILVFLIALLLTRITTNWVILTNYVNAKTILCFGLIYFFYRLVGTYLLISPTLGPMIYKVNGMVRVEDLLHNLSCNTRDQVPRLLNFFMLNSAEHEISTAHKY